MGPEIETSRIDLPEAATAHLGPADPLPPSPAPRRAVGWAALVMGLALLAMGAGMGVSASSLARGGAATVGPNLPIDAQATSQRDLTANNSPSVVRNPTDAANLAVANRIDSPGFSCALHVSTDGGASWTATTVPFPAGEELPARCYAPDVAFGTDGTLYLSFATLIGVGNTPHAVWLSASHDRGATLSTPRRVVGPLAFGVRLAADPLRAGRLYLSWLQADRVGLYEFPDTGNPVVVSRSDDGGATWSAPVPASSPSRLRVVAPSTVVGPGGVVYLLYLDLGADRLDYEGAHQGRGGPPYAGTWSLVLARSADAGRTWAETVVDAAVVPTERFIVFLPPSPSLAVDRRTGRVYVAFEDGRLGDADVWLWSSPAGGASFGPPKRVNDTRPHDGTSQYLPRLAVAPGGRLDVVYYDRRADRADVDNQVSFQSSGDGGATFTRSLRLSDRPSSSLVGFGSERGLADLGSRLALLSTDRGALAVWTDTRAGTPSSEKQDLARQLVAFSTPSRWRGPLRDGGLLVAAAGLALGGVTLARAARSRPGGSGETETDDE